MAIDGYVCKFIAHRKFDVSNFLVRLIVRIPHFQTPPHVSVFMDYDNSPMYIVYICVIYIYIG